MLSPTGAFKRITFTNKDAPVCLYTSGTNDRKVQHRTKRSGRFKTSKEVVKKIIVKLCFILNGLIPTGPQVATGRNGSVNECVERRFQ
jgi:hypothetical protein